MRSPLAVDAAIVGGGIAGLWILDELVRAGHQALLIESQTLGHGQTISSQGIIHGGLKYTLRGALTAAAQNIRRMPALWRECLAGRRPPQLRHTRERSAFCYLWRTETARSRIGLVGARAGLHTRPVAVSREDRPGVLAGCPGEIFRVDEPVVDPASLLTDLSGRHTPRLLQCRSEDGLAFELDGPGKVARLVVRAPAGNDELLLRPDCVILAAGEGNAALRARIGLSRERMQRRPLHMVMVRGDLPALFGHCVDAAHTRVTITWDRDGAGRGVWLVGGQTAEDGVRLEPVELISRARTELLATLPGLNLRAVEWSTYRVDRAEPRTRTGLRPADAWCRREGNVLTVWPTKLALAPRLAELVCAHVGRPTKSDAGLPDDLGWPRPVVARLPWEVERAWISVS